MKARNVQELYIVKSFSVTQVRGTEGAGGHDAWVGVAIDLAQKVLYVLLTHFTK